MQIKQESTKHLPPPTVVQYQEAREAIRQRIARSIKFFTCRNCFYPTVDGEVCGFCGFDNFKKEKEKKQEPQSEFLQQVKKLRTMTNEQVQRILDSIAEDPECSSPHIRFYESEAYTMFDWATEVYNEVSRREFLYKQD